MTCKKRDITVSALTKLRFFALFRLLCVWKLLEISHDQLKWAYWPWTTSHNQFSYLHNFLKVWVLFSSTTYLLLVLNNNTTVLYYRIFFIIIIIGTPWIVHVHSMGEVFSFCNLTSGSSLFQLQVSSCSCWWKNKKVWSEGMW